MQPLHYPTLASQVGLMETLLSGTTLAWFSPILKKNSPLLYNFDGFMAEFATSLEEIDKIKIVDFKIRNLW